MIVCQTSGSGLPGSSRRLRGTTDTRLAEVTESPLANKVTSWPIWTSASVRYETTRSVPPYARGGTLSYNGATWAILTVFVLWVATLPARRLRAELLRQHVAEGSASGATHL